VPQSGIISIIPVFHFSLPGVQPTSIRSEHIHDLRSFIERIQSADSVEYALQHLVDAAADILQADKASVVVRSESGLLQVRAFHWPGSDPAEGISGEVLATGEPLLVTDITPIHVWNASAPPATAPAPSSRSRLGWGGPTSPSST
jgi:hypothetical protein